MFIHVTFFIYILITLFVRQKHKRATKTLAILKFDNVMCVTTLNDYELLCVCVWDKGLIGWIFLEWYDYYLLIDLFFIVWWIIHYESTSHVTCFLHIHNILEISRKGKKRHYQNIKSHLLWILLYNMKLLEYHVRKRLTYSYLAHF